MSYLRQFENLIEIVELTGLLYGKTAKSIKVLGNRAGFTSTAVFNDIKEFDNSVANLPVLAASTLDIISSSVNDTAAGTGVRQVKVLYIDSTNNLVESAAINLNGTTLVTSVLTGVNEVIWMETFTAGSTGWAEGNIRLRINGGTVEVEQITALNNKSLTARFMVPTGYTGYLNAFKAHAINNDQQTRLTATVNSFDGTVSAVYHAQVNCSVATNTNSGQIFVPFIKIPALARVKVSTISAGTAAAVKCDTSFVIVIIAD